MYKEWEGFVPGKWSNNEVNVRNFIQTNYVPYEGDGSFLAPATEATKKLWEEVLELCKRDIICLYKVSNVYFII